MEEKAFFGKPWLIDLIVVFILLAGLAVRLLDLTELPIDFRPTRQLYSAIKARGMYYQLASWEPKEKRALAVQMWQDEISYEPPMLETIVAGTYLIVGEYPWIARIYSSIFWLLGGLALFNLARKMTSPDGALIALIYYVFLYFGVLASRSFQPDPLMVALMLAGLWAFYKWLELHTWKWVIIAGLLSGFAIFAKPPMAGFLLLGAFALSILDERGFRPAIRDRQVWSLALISALPTLIYLIDGIYIRDFLKVQSSLRFFPELWVDPVFYIRWYNLIGNTVGNGAFLLALLSIFLADKKNRSLLMGLWFGYLAYGFAFAHHISSHDYYQLPLIPVVAVSLAFTAKTLFEKIIELNPRPSWSHLAIAAFILLGVINAIWDVRVNLYQDDHRSEARFWEQLGDKLGHTTKVMSLTQDYGHRLAYFGWQNSSPWLVEGDFNVREQGGVDINPDAQFAEAVSVNQYFVVTMFNQLENQPRIKKLLYENYPIFEQGDGYVIFDLQHPLKP